MRDCLSKLPSELLDLIQHASGRAHEQKVRVYLVGGFVRDVLLGLQNLDLDMVVEGDGIAFADGLAHTLGVKIVRHRRFGTATLAVKPHLKLDIATVRTEYYPGPGHLPVVEPGLLKEDLFRRDFSINAMAVDITPDHYGALIDFFGGRADLKARTIRVLHDASFLDDPTRILRAVRFEQRLRFGLEPHTMKLLKEAVKLDMFSRVDAQRMRDDLILLLKEAYPLRGIRRLGQLCGFSFLSPGLSITQRTYRLLVSIDKQVRWFRKLHVRRRMLDSWLIYFMGLTDSLSDAQARGLMRRFGFRSSDESRLLDYRSMLPQGIAALKKRGVRPSEIYALLEPLSYESILMLKSLSADRWLQRHIEDFFGRYNGMRISVSGDELRSLGLSPGPVYQKIFTRLLHAKLDGSIKTPEEEIAFIKKIAGALKS